MTSNAYDYGKAPIKGEGMALDTEGPPTPEEQIMYLQRRIDELNRYRFVGLRLRTIAKEGNLMINHPTQGFVLVEDLEQYMMEKL